MHIALAIDDAFAYPATVVIYSALTSLDATRRLSVHIVDGGMTRVSHNRMMNVVGRRADLTFYPATNAFRVEEQYLADVHLTSATTLRLELAGLLPSSLDRVIYLDADLLVLGDLGLLWDVELSGMVVGAVRDQCISGRHLMQRTSLAGAAAERYKRSGVEKVDYFNAGLLLIDLGQWRQRDVEGHAKRLLETEIDQLQFLDQDALNAVLIDCWTELPIRWNRMMWEYKNGISDTTATVVLSDGGILHFNGSRKPWSNYRSLGLVGDRYVTLAKAIGWDI